MDTMDERMRILDQIERGEISADEGARQLDQLGKEEPSPLEGDGNDRMKILEGIEQGLISPDEGASKLQQANLSIPSGAKVGRANPGNATMAVTEDEILKWRSWWMIPFWVGSAVVILAGLWMNSTYQAAGANFWFYCSWVPMLLGLSLAMIGVLSQNSRWLHIRIRHKGGSHAHVALSFPLPIGLTTWLLRTFGGMIPGLDDTSLDEIIVALSNESGNNPIFIQVDDDEDGEQVEIFIG